TNVEHVRRVLTDLELESKDQQTLFIKTLPIVHYIAIPEMENTAEKTIKIQNTKVKTLFDSGSPTSFIRRDIVELLKYEIYETPPLRFRGFVATKSAVTSEAVTIDLKINDLHITLAAYILDNMDYQLLIGNPILRRYPKILHTVLNTRESPDSLKPKTYRSETVNNVRTYSAGNRGNPRNTQLSLAPTILEATDPKSAGNRGDPRTKTLSLATTTPAAIDPLTTLDNPGSTQSTFAQFPIPEEASILEEDGKYSDVVSTIQSVEPNATDHSNKDTFCTLPVWLQQKYREIIRNDLPPRPADINNIPVKHDIEIKPGARLPRLQPYHVTEKNEQEINKIVQKLA
ncbi:YGR109W-B-like protein, partial [Saccharomyces cerevisiae VL3]